LGLIRLRGAHGRDERLAVGRELVAGHAAAHEHAADISRLKLGGEEALGCVCSRLNSPASTCSSSRNRTKTRAGGAGVGAGAPGV